VTTRTSNKQLLEAIEQQTAAIAALAEAMTANAVAQQPVAAAPVTNVTGTPETLGKAKFNAKYMAHMDNKVKDLVAADGNSRVLYGRQNGDGEWKLAYCLKSRYDTGLKDRGFRGVIKVYGS